MNAFDAAIYVIATIAIVTGYRVGLIRSAATILGYVAAMPLAVAATSYLAPVLAARTAMPGMQSPLVFFAIFVVCGITLGTTLRLVVNETVGPNVGFTDSLAGSALGVVRVVLVATTLVLVFDRIIPAGHDPAFLAGSQLRPILSAAAARGLRALPPETASYIDKLKQDNLRGLRSL